MIPAMKHPRWYASLAFALSIGAALSPAHARSTFLDPNSATGTSAAVVVDPAPLAHTAQFLPVDEQGGIVAKGDVRAQTERVLARLDAALRKADSSLADAVKLNICVARSALTAEVTGVLARRFAGEAKPAVTIVAGALAHPDALVSIDAVAVSRSRSDSATPRHIVGTKRRFSAVTILPPTGVLYVAGLADKSDLAEATKVTLGKIVTAAEFVGLKRRDIVQLKAFLQPMTKVDVVERAVAEFFAGETVPAIVYVDWISTGVPIEIEAIVAAPADKADRSVTYHSPPGMPGSPVYSRLARIHSGARIYVSGLYGTSETSADVKDIFGQLDALLARAGSDRTHLAKATYYYSAAESNSRLDAFRPSYFDRATPPAASKARVPEVGLPGKGITIDLIGAAK